MCVHAILLFKLNRMQKMAGELESFCVSVGGYPSVRQTGSSRVLVVVVAGNGPRRKCQLVRRRRAAEQDKEKGSRSSRRSVSYILLAGRVL